MNIEIANRLRQMRNKNNLSQEELAAKMGVSRQAVSKWERAEASPDTENLILLAKLYRVSIDELLNTDSSPKSANSGVSLKKDDYGYRGEPVREAVPENYTEKEIYPNASAHESTSIPQGSPFGADLGEDEKKASGGIGETMEKAGLAIGDILNSAGKKIEDGVRKATSANGKDWETGVENFCEGLNKGLDKMCSGIDKGLDKLEKKIGEKDSKYNYSYNYNYNSQSTGQNSGSTKKSKKAAQNRRPMTLLDKTLPIFITGFFFLMCAIDLAHPGWTVFLLIPLYYTGIEAVRKRNPMIFCYPVLCAYVYFTIGGLLEHSFRYWADNWYELMWLIFLTIPLYYTLYPAIKKRNPLIFCYPVLCAIVYIGMGILLSMFWWRLSDRWFAFMWAPIGLTIPLYYIVISHYRNQKKSSAGNPNTVRN
ncbi:MAG: helix-turn-helix domain-containing protein [Oscillospiraceae bacterium]|nr:helix-turn-helix domain-containing protein [Oscillospiraceae bacterium]